MISNEAALKNDIQVTKERTADGWYTSRLSASGTEGKMNIILKSRKPVWAGFYTAGDTSHICEVVFYPPGHKLGFASGYKNAVYPIFIELKHGNPKEYLGSISGDLHELLDTTGAAWTYNSKIIRVPRGGIQFLFAYQKNDF